MPGDRAKARNPEQAHENPGVGNFLAGIKGRLLAWAVVAAVLIPAAMCGISQANKPETYPGDQIAWRECKSCQGKGCALCDDKGSLWVITPGPNHPVWVVLRIHEAGATQPPVEFEKPEEALKAIPGAIGGARVAFRQGDKLVEASSGLTGRARVRLAPGTWSYTVERKDYREATGTVEVPTLQAEIWKTRSPEDTLSPPVDVALQK